MFSLIYQLFISWSSLKRLLIIVFKVLEHILDCWMFCASAEFLFSGNVKIVF